MFNLWLGMGLYQKIGVSMTNRKTNQYDMTFFIQASNKASDAVAAETKNDD